MKLIRSILGVVIQVVIFGSVLLLPTGAFAWRRAWLLISLMAAFSAWSSWALPQRVLDERWKPPLQTGQPPADKILVVFFIAAFLGAILFIPVDVFRLHLMRKPGTLVSFAGLALLVAGCWIMYLSLRENTFASPAVRHQGERGQTVVDTGVYGVVRHPMYAAGALLSLGIPLWLESYAAALLAIVPIGLLALRIPIEEELLERELAGYASYEKRVSKRLIPFIW